MLVDPTAFRNLASGKTKGPIASIARLGLRLCSAPYAAAAGLRNLAFDRGWRSVHRVSAPVVSIGNLTVGGTGKTPMVEFIGRRFRQLGVRVAILSRGYGSADGPNDEFLVLEENLPDAPHLQGRDRVELARIAVEELESQLLILDDGFQHRRLHRDLDIVLLDALDPFGGGRQLPAGLLRESIRSLARARVVVLTRADAVDAAARAAIRDEVFRKVGERPWVEASFPPTALQSSGGESSPVDSLRGRDIFAFCGIGNPDGFWRTLEQLGARIVERRSFPDHHAYTAADVAELSRWVNANSAAIAVTTQKDLVKLRTNQLGAASLYALRIEARVEDGLEVLDGLLREMATRALAEASNEDQ